MSVVEMLNRGRKRILLGSRQDPSTSPRRHVVQALVEGHAAEGTWVTLDDVLNRKEKNSSGESARPIDVAATDLKFDIVVLPCGERCERRKVCRVEGPMVTRDAKRVSWIAV